MDLYVAYTKTEINDAAEKELQITNDCMTDINRHLSNIKKRILIDDNTILSIIAALNAGFHIILYGPPGTAKTTISEFLPVEFYGAKCNLHTADSEWNVRKVIGGVAVTYDNSVFPAREQIGPKDGYIVEDILECYESRLETTDFDTVFTVIDEFNRTNMDECLGPMFTAMGSEDKTLKLDYNKGFKDDFLQIKIPKGYRIICNMNKYDRTFTNELSEALSRRFKWIYIGAPESDDYSQEEQIVDGNVFGIISSIKPNMPVNLTDIEKCENSVLFETCITAHIYTVINDLRNDLEVGTSYKIDAIRLANHFFKLKMAAVDWSLYPGADAVKACSKTSAEDVGALTNPGMEFELCELIRKIIRDTIDAALVMTVVPACESLEEIDAIERNRLRFEQFERCKSELERMKISL